MEASNTVTREATSKIDRPRPREAAHLAETRRMNHAIRHEPEA